MNRLKKRQHLNVDVKKRGFVFAMCTMCKSLKDWISKLGRNSNDAREYELKLKKHLLHQKSNKSLYHTWRSNLCSSNMSSYVLSMTKWIMQKLHSQGCKWRTKWFVDLDNCPLHWRVDSTWSLWWEICAIFQWVVA
jgi:hypothetical protein